MLELIDMAAKEEQSVIGIRKRTEETEITESFYRSIFHHGYLLVVRLFLGLRCEDLQCGAKVIRGEHYRTVADTLQEDGFCIDTELLTALKERGFGWLEIPINWAEKKGGKGLPTDRQLEDVHGRAAHPQPASVGREQDLGPIKHPGRAV